MVTIWSWPSSTARRVKSMKPETSEPRKFSPSPRPTTSGELRRAATTTSGWSACTASRVKAPSRRWQAQLHGLGEGAVGRRRRASCVRGRCRPAARRPPRCRSRSGTSRPCALSSSLSSAKFSMMPLWIRASWPSSARCGCAFWSVGPPWVAQRVWPMPVSDSGQRVGLEFGDEVGRACPTSCGTKWFRRPRRRCRQSRSRGIRDGAIPQGRRPGHRVQYLPAAECQHIQRFHTWIQA